MVVSGIPIYTDHHAREVCDMAIDLVRACEIFVIPHLPEEPLKIRIGLHTGGYSISNSLNVHIFEPPNIEKSVCPSIYLFVCVCPTVRLSCLSPLSYPEHSYKTTYKWIKLNLVEW